MYLSPALKYAFVAVLRFSLIAAVLNKLLIDKDISAHAQSASVHSIDMELRSGKTNTS